MADTQDLVPPLRPDVVIETSDDDGGRLLDARLGRKLKLDTRGLQVARLLDRPQTLSELLARIADKTGRPMTEEVLGRVLAAFEGLGFLDTAATEDVAQRMNMAEEEWRRDPQSVKLVIPDDLRFECKACGSCCLGANIGPVTEDVLAGLAGERQKELFSQYAGRKGLFFAMVPADGQEEIVVCQSRNGACLFLDQDGLCGIHRRYGPEAKPHVCRLFPYQFVLTPDGLVVGLQLECRSILEASKGRPLSEQTGLLRSLLPLVTHAPSVRQFLSLDGVATLSYEDYKVLEDEAVRAVSAASSGYEAVLASARVVMARLAAASRPAVTPLAASDLTHEFYGFLQELGERLAKLKAEHMTDGEGVCFHTSNLDLLLDAMSDIPLYADTILGQEQEADSQRFARLALTNAWRSKDLVIPPNLLIGQAMLALRWFFTRACAVTLARRVSRRAPGPQDLVDGWIAVHMLLRNKRVLKVLSSFRDVLVRLFVEQFDAIVSSADRLVTVNPATDFYMF